MAVKTFEREVKKLSNEFTNLIETYDFEEYDFHSIRQTLQDYIERTYPNYNDYFRSDYVMMLIELFAFYGEMMAYRMDTNMNEVYLSTAKERRNIIKIADMLGYKYKRLTPSYSIGKVDLSDAPGGSSLLYKIKSNGSLNDIMNKSAEIDFKPFESLSATYYPNKLDYLLKNISSEEFMNTLHNIFNKLEDFSYNQHVKTKRVIEDNFEYFERSIFVDKFQMRFDPNVNIYVKYANGIKTFEVQNLLFDSVEYFKSDNTEDALNYDADNLYSETVSLGFEFVLKYDKGHNIIDKNVYLYIPSVQGGTFTREVKFDKPIKNFKTTIYEQNIFSNKTIIRQYDPQGNVIRTYYEVENLNNHPFKYAYEVNNTENGHIELIFGDGKNSEILLPAESTKLFYRKNMKNSDEVLNVKNAELKYIELPISYYDKHVGRVQTTSQNLELVGNFNASDGYEAETDEQIKYMARKLRSIQDRFVTAPDYETAGMLHPRVKYSTVLLRSYIGKNSPRMANEFIDIFFDATRNDIEIFKITDQLTNNVKDVFLITPTSYFTESSVTDKVDSIKFIDNNIEYFFDIFDPDTISANEWFNYPESFLDPKSKGTIIRLKNIKLSQLYLSNVFDVDLLNTILPMEYNIESIEYKTISDINIYFMLKLSSEIDDTVFMSAFEASKPSIITQINNIFKDVVITDVNIFKVDNQYSFNLSYITDNIKIPEEDLTYVWTHYKSDDIYISPSKSNIIEIYVTGIKKDLKKNIEIYQPLTSSELNKLVKDINKRKMISDVVQVYNSSTYAVEIALKIYRLKGSSITIELLQTKVNRAIDNFFDISNIPLGKHFYLSRLIEWIHNNVEEVQHIEMINDDNEKPITPTSTLDIIGEKIIFTQIVEKQELVNNQFVPVRTIDIIL